MELETDEYYMDTEDGIYILTGTMYLEKIGRYSFEWGEAEVYIHPDDWGNQLCIYNEPTELWMFGSLLPP